MRTKYIRFNKLPKLESQADQEDDRASSRANVRANPLASAVGFRRSDPNRPEELFEAIANLMKKSERQARDF